MRLGLSLPCRRKSERKVVGIAQFRVMRGRDLACPDVGRMQWRLGSAGTDGLHMLRESQQAGARQGRHRLGHLVVVPHGQALLDQHMHRRWRLEDAARRVQ
jgi:hypothetical protein